MDIKALNAVQNYAASRPATEPNAGPGGAGEAFKGLAKDFATTLQESEKRPPRPR